METLRITSVAGRVRIRLRKALSLLPSYLNWLLVVLLAALFLINILRSVQLMLQWYSPLPLADYWRVAQDVPAYYSGQFSVLWRQHNEHRIVFPEIVYAADVLLFRGRQILPLAANFLCYLGVWGVLAWCVYSQRSIASPWREAALLLAGAVMFWEGCAKVLATPFQLAFTLLQFSVSISFVFLALLRETGKNVYLLALIIAAVVATYSAAGGMLVWPILLLGAVLLKISMPQTAAIGLCGAVAMGLFFIGYQSLGSVHLLLLFKHFGYLVSFVAEYLAMPFDFDLTRRAAVWGWRIGILNLAIFACCLAVAIRKRAWSTRLGIVIFGTYVYTLASVLLTAAGRMDPDDSYFSAPKAPRYVTVPMAAMGTLLLAAVWLLSKTRLRRFSMPFAFAAAALACFGWLRTEVFVARAAQVFSELQITSLMLRNNLEDGPILLTIFPNAAFVRQSLLDLRSRRLSLYTHGADAWLGKDVKSLWPFAQPVPGQIMQVYPVAGGLEIYGWSDSPFLEDEHAVLFIDQDQKIAGFGTRPRAGFPLGFGTWNTPPALAFVGFVQTNPSLRSLRAYIWAHPAKTLHPMGEPIALPNLTPAVNTGASLAAMTWHADAAFRLNGQRVSDENGPAPPGPIYGSYGSGITGELRSEPVAVPADHCLVLPVLHGLSSYGQSVTLLNANTNDQIASAPMFDGRSPWERWQVRVPSDVVRISVLARDAGEGDNQWLAVAPLTACP